MSSDFSAACSCFAPRGLTEECVARLPVSHRPPLSLAHIHSLLSGPLRADELGTALIDAVGFEDGGWELVETLVADRAGSERKLAAEVRAERALPISFLLWYCRLRCSQGSAQGRRSLGASERPQKIEAPSALTCDHPPPPFLTPTSSLPRIPRSH